MLKCEFWRGLMVTMACVTDHQVFYGGGVGSVRGMTLTLWEPRDIKRAILGGNKSVVTSAEWLFPMPGMEKEKSLRV